MFSGLTSTMPFEVTLAGVIEGAASAPSGHYDLLRRNLRLSCIPAELSTQLSWRDGWSHFSAGGPWMHLLEGREDNSEQLQKIVAEQEAARGRARVFAGYSSRIRSTREIGGDLLMEVAELFRAPPERREGARPRYERMAV